MKKITIASLFTIMLLAFAACGGSAASNSGSSSSTANSNTITMGQSNFVGSTSVTIKAGQSVNFVDPSSSGGTHILAIGTNGTFTSATGAPTSLNTASGLTINAGQTQTIVFPTAGVYHVTCIIHPAMNVTVTVNS